jgi:hypothetical protein
MERRRKRFRKRRKDVDPHGGDLAVGEEEFGRRHEEVGVEELGVEELGVRSLGVRRQRLCAF